MLEEVTGLITSVGFPIVVVIYLLWERQTSTKELISVLYQVKETLIKLEGKIHD